MDRDIALALSEKLTNIKNTLQTLATNTIPTADNRSVSPDPEEQQRSAPAEDPEEPEVLEEEPEAPAEEPETRTKK